MRDVERIDGFLIQLGEIWKKKVPDWRFGQLISNLIDDSGDPFYWEEEYFLDKVKEFFAEDED